jgi:hypothetical protein
MVTKPAVMVFRKGGSSAGAKEAPTATTGKAPATTKPDTSLSTKNFVVPRLKVHRTIQRSRRLAPHPGGPSHRGYVTTRCTLYLSLP